MTDLPIIANLYAHNTVKRFSAPIESGLYVDDCALGRQLADDLIEYARNTGYRSTLCDVVRDLVEARKCGAVQVGFFHRIMEYAAA